MFAKLARNFDHGRARHSGAAGRPCNDNHPGRHVVASSRRLSKPVLACRWQETPAGTLECIWHIEPAGASVAEEPRALGSSKPPSPLGAPSRQALLLYNVLRNVA